MASNRVERLQRWASLIRSKAFELEVPLRKAGKAVCVPDLFSIAHEIESFIDGYYEEEIIIRKEGEDE